MFKPEKKQQDIVGIDIGSYSIKVASVRKKADKHLLTAYNVKKLPIIGDTQLKKPKLIEEALQEVDLKPEEVNLSISGPSVIVRFVTMPRMNKEQLESAMTFEAERYIPFNLNEVILDFIQLDAVGSTEMNVLLAAAKREFVNSLIEVFRTLGLSINVLDINAFASFNAFTRFNTLQEEFGTAFFDLGHGQTNVLISTGTTPRFMRVVQIGGKDIDTAISEELHIKPGEAESLRKSEDGQNDEKVKQAISTVLDELVKEMQLSFGYFENKYSKPVNKVYCSGGMVYQKGVIQYMQEKLGLELTLWNPVGNMDVSDSLSREAIAPIASQLGVSIGLSLRE